MAEYTPSDDDLIRAWKAYRDAADAANAWVREDDAEPAEDEARRALAATEHRATRAEAQSEARRINAEYWKEQARIMTAKRDAGVRVLADVMKERNNALTRIKAVEDVLDVADSRVVYDTRYAVTSNRMDTIVNGAAIRRALDGDA